MKVKNIQALKELTGDNFKWGWYSGVVSARGPFTFRIYGINRLINHHKKFLR